jgi:glyoxalase-like protein
MMRSALDHLVVVAPTLAEGIASVREALGVGPQRGGEHSRMGTHNALLRLGGAMYLEVIAVNPTAPDPGRARWFGLDRLQAGSAPRLATWVARTDDARTAMAVSPIPPGSLEPMTRGDLAWTITIPAGGELLEGGVAPMLIQWTGGSHPAGRLPDVGLSLERLDLVHPRRDAIASMLEWIGFEGQVCVTQGEHPALVAHVRTPAGSRTLSS